MHRPSEISRRSTALSLVIFLDYLYYGQITFAPVNFFIINLSGVSLFYGGNPWHYYLTQALPILCTTSLPFVLYGMWTQVNGIDPAKRTLCRVIIWTIAIYSSMGHKEWRFIHPVLPLMHVLGAKVLVDLSDKSPKQKISSLPIRRDYFSMLLIPIPIALYVTLLYCSAPVAVLSYIRSIPSDELKGGSVGFLMPCHSTPGHAYIHRSELASGGMWALGCEPPLEYVFMNNHALSSNKPVSTATKICPRTEIKPRSSSRHRTIICKTVFRLRSIQTFLFRRIQFQYRVLQYIFRVNGDTNGPAISSFSEPCSRKTVLKICFWPRSIKKYGMVADHGREMGRSVKEASACGNGGDDYRALPLGGPRNVNFDVEEHWSVRCIGGCILKVHANADRSP